VGDGSFNKKILLKKEYEPGEASYTGNILSLQVDKYGNLTFFDVFNDTVKFVQMDTDSGRIIDSKSIIKEEGFGDKLVNIKRYDKDSFIYSNSKGEVVIDNFDTGESKVLMSSVQLEKDVKK